MLKSGQASKDKNCQVTERWSTHCAAAGVPLRRVTVSWLNLEGLSWRFHCRFSLLAPCSHSPHGKTGCSAPRLPAAKLCAGAGMGRTELGMGPQCRPEWASNTIHEIQAECRRLCWSHCPVLERGSRAGPPLPQQHPMNRWKLASDHCPTVQGAFLSPHCHSVAVTLPTSLQQPPAPLSPHSQGAQPGSRGTQGTFGRAVVLQ